MKDFNFFEPIIEKKSTRKIKDPKLVATVAGVSLAVLIALFPAVNGGRILLMKSQTKNHKKALESSEYQEKISDLEQKESLVATFKEKNVQMKSINKELESKDRIGSFIVSKISESLPIGVFINSLSIEASGITIDGVALEKESVALFQNNLRKVPYFKEVFVPSIVKEAEFNTFSLDLILKSEEKKHEKTD